MEIDQKNEISENEIKKINEQQEKEIAPKVEIEKQIIPTTNFFNKIGRAHV